MLIAEVADRDPPSPASLTNAIGMVTDDLDDVLRAHLAEQSPDWVVHALELRGPEAWHLACVERGTDALDAAVEIDRDDVEELFRTLATEPRATRLHNPALVAAARRLDRRHVLRRGRDHAEPAPAGRAGAPLMRHPSGRPTLAAAPRLFGRRVMLRPLGTQDFPAWSEVRVRNDDWLTPWEPRRPVPEFDPTTNRNAFNSRCAARERDAANGLSYGFGVFVTVTATTASAAR